VQLVHVQRVEYLSMRLPFLCLCIAQMSANAKIFTPGSVSKRFYSKVVRNSKVEQALIFVCMYVYVFMYVIYDCAFFVSLDVVMHCTHDT
jgi:hypothetical protein